MLVGGGVFGLVVIAFWVWAIFDVITTDESQCRNLPKSVWLMLVIFLSSIGALAWLLLGRPENASFRIGDTSPRTPGRRPGGAEDSPRWGSPSEATSGHEAAREDQERERRERYAQMDAELDRRIEEKLQTEKRLAEWEERLRRREAELEQRKEAGGAES